METGEPTDGAGYQGTFYDGGSAYYSWTNSKIEIVLPGANAFARNMAKAKANSSVRNAGKQSPAGIKASRKRAKFLNRTVEVYATPNFWYQSNTLYQKDVRQWTSFCIFGASYMSDYFVVKGKCIIFATDI